MSAIGLFESKRRKAGGAADTIARRPGRPVCGLAFAAVIFAASAAARAGDTGGIAGLGLSSDECFDMVPVVLNDRPSRRPVTPRVAHVPASNPEMDGLPPPDDSRPILTVMVKQPRACAPYPDVGAPVPARGLGVIADPTDSSAARAGDLLATAGGGFPSLPGPAFPPTLADTQASTDGAVGLRFASGFAFARFPSRGPAVPSARGAPPMSFAPGEADELARNLSQGRSAVDPTAAQPGLTDSTPPTGLVGAAPSLPEPSTWLLLIAGMFGAGASLRRRTCRPAI